jgi:hypothetical protein
MMRRALREAWVSGTPGFLDHNRRRGMLDHRLEPIIGALETRSGG